MISLSRVYIFSFILIASILSDDCSSFEIGDINNDNHLNIIDIVASVEIVLNNNFNEKADLNFDNIVDVVDIIALIDLILNPFVLDVQIESIDFDFTSLFIKWNKTSNNQFTSYNLYYSNYIDNDNYLLSTVYEKLDTNLIINDIALNERNFFSISLKDITGCELISDEYLFELPSKLYQLDSHGNIEYTEFNTNDFKPSIECSGCHEEHYNEWFSSMHSYTSRSPLFFSYKSKTIDDHPQVGEKFCMQCHNPISFLSGISTSEYTSVEQFQNSNLPESIKDGIGCDVCHTITGLSNSVITGENLSANAEYNMYPLGNIKFGSIQNPESNNFHDSYYLPSFSSSQMCLPCHDLVINNVEAEITFTEWARIPGFSMFGGVSCQDCHMPLKENGYHSHKFVGVDIDLSIPLAENDMKNDVEELLQTSASLEFEYQGISISNYLNNEGVLSIPITVTSNTGHSLPSGTSFNRQVWLEIIVENNDVIIFESGKVVNNEQLDFDDSNLLLFRSIITDNQGNISNNVTDIGNLINYSLLAYSQREKIYDVDIPPGLTGVLDVSARLLFRPFNPDFILEHHPEFLDNLPIYEIDSINSQIIIQ